MIVLIWIGFILSIIASIYCIYRAVTTTLSAIKNKGAIKYLREDAGLGFWAFVLVIGPIVGLVLAALLFGYLASRLCPFA